MVTPIYRALLTYRVLLTVITLVTAAACSGPTSPSSHTQCAGGVTVSVGSGTMTAQVNGTPWTASNCIHFDSYLGINGLTGDYQVPVATGSAIGDTSLNISGFTGVGTYQIGPTSNLFAHWFAITSSGDPLWAANGNDGSGTLTLTTFTPSAMAGTFSFTLVPDSTQTSNPATGTVVITNGAFNISLTASP
jgi:hypothetical protein